MWETGAGAPAGGSASWIISLTHVSLKRYRAKKPRTNHLLAMRDPAFRRHHSYLGFRTELENRVGDAGVMPVVRRGQVTQVKMESTGNRRNSCLGEADSASSHENRSAQGCATCMVSRQPSKWVRKHCTVTEDEFSLRQWHEDPTSNGPSCARNACFRALRTTSGGVLSLRACSKV
jgi:hypothetical protein